MNSSFGLSLYLVEFMDFIFDKLNINCNRIVRFPDLVIDGTSGLIDNFFSRKVGLEAMKKRNEEKAKILYDFLDESKLAT